MNLNTYARMLEATAPRPRTLGHILCDLNDVQQALKPFCGSAGQAAYSDAELREWDYLDDKRDTLRKEARTMIERLTGCSYDAIEGGLA